MTFGSSRAQAEELGIDATIILDPMRRDSAPAIAAGAVLACRRDPDAVVLTLAADHVILDEDLFHAACAAGRDAAAAGRIVTFGIPPPRQRRITAISGAADRSVLMDVTPLQPLSKNRMPQPQAAMSPTATCGTREIFCFAPTPCCLSSRSSRRQSSKRPQRRSIAPRPTSASCGLMRRRSDKRRKRRSITP